MRDEAASEIVGLIPAAGHASRLPDLACSKEIVPVRFPDEGGPPQPSGLHLLQCLRRAGIGRAYIVLRSGKWDIPACFGSGEKLGVDLAYLVTDTTPGIPHTLDRAFPFIQDALVALGFPDTLIRPPTAFVSLLARQRSCAADVVLGLFPADQPGRTDMVETDDAGRVRDIHVKDPASRLSHNWCIAVWTPAFSRYLHDFLRYPSERTAPHEGELYPGHVLRAALADGLRIEGVKFCDGSFLDIGTRNDLSRATGRQPPKLQN